MRLLAKQMIPNCCIVLNWGGGRRHWLVYIKLHLLNNCPLICGKLCNISRQLNLIYYQTNETYLFPLAKNNIKPGKQAMTNLDMVKSSAKSTISEISDIVVHSSVKGCRDVTRSRRKSTGNLGQGHATLSVSPGRKRKLTPCKSAGNLGQGHATLSLSSGRKRRHSSTDNEKDGELVRFSLLQVLLLLITADISFINHCILVTLQIHYSVS